MREHLGSHTKSLGIGRASQGGLEAAFLAAGRMESSIEAIDWKRGWITCVWPNEEVRLERLEVLQSAFIAEMAWMAMASGRSRRMPLSRSHAGM